MQITVGRGTSRRVFVGQTGPTPGLPKEQSHKLRIEREKAGEVLKNYLFRPALLS